jgi:hypothetical protein
MLRSRIRIGAQISKNPGRFAFPTLALTGDLSYSLEHVQKTEHMTQLVHDVDNPLRPECVHIDDNSTTFVVHVRIPRKRRPPDGIRFQFYWIYIQIVSVVQIDDIFQFPVPYESSVRGVGIVTSLTDVGISRVTTISTVPAFFQVYPPHTINNFVTFRIADFVADIFVRYAVLLAHGYVAVFVCLA